MKTKLLYGVAAVILVALLAMAGCSNPFTGGSGTNGRHATIAVTDSGSLNTLANGPVEIVLLAGQDQVAGTVNVTNDAENLYVEFLPSEQWCIIETHVHVANTLDGFPLVGRWRTPAPGQFDFKTEHDCEPPYEYTIALGELDVHEDFIIAAHAKLSDGKVTETAWAAGTRFATQGNWATYFTYSWTFMRNLDVAPEGKGSVAGQGRYPAGAEVTIEATPVEHWRFVNWTEGDEQVGSDAEMFYTMPARDHTLTANFEESEPEAFDLTGYWDAYLLMNGNKGDRDGPYLFYFVQTGNTLDGYNSTGSVDGSVVTLSVGADEDDAVTIVGTIENNDLFTGTVDFGGELVGAEFRRVDDLLQFGSLQLSGLVNFESDKALGGEEPDYTEYFLRFQIKAGSLEGVLSINTDHGLAPGEYDVFDGRGDLGEDEVDVFFFDHNTWDDFGAEDGWLVLDQYDPDGVVSGSFEVYFEDSSNWLGGSFYLDQPTGSGATVTITDGQWNGLPVETGTTDGLSWERGEEFNHGPRYVAFMDEELLVFLWLEPQMEMAVGSFAVPDEMEVSFEYRPEGSPPMEEERAVSGTVVVSEYQEGIGMSGYFSGVQLEHTSGSLAGSFDVAFELNGRMMVGGD